MLTRKKINFFKNAYMCIYVYQMYVTVQRCTNNKAYIFLSLKLYVNRRIAILDKI